MKLHRATEQLDVNDSDLSGSMFNDANLSSTTFNQINFSGAKFNDSKMSGWHVNDVTCQARAFSDYQFVWGGVFEMPTYQRDVRWYSFGRDDRSL